MTATKTSAPTKAAKPTTATATASPEGWPERRKMRLHLNDDGIAMLAETLRAALDLAPGDEVELTTGNGQATLRKVPPPATPEEATAAVAALRGLLRDYFKDWGDINQFIEEERHGWVDRQERQEAALNPPQERSEPSKR